jgi:hypothetical protein
MGLVQSLLRTSLPPTVTPSPEVVNTQTITPALEVPHEVTSEVVTTQTVTPALEVSPEVTSEVVTTQTVTPALEVPSEVSPEVGKTQPVTPAVEDITAATDAPCNAEHPSTPKKGPEVLDPISPPPLQRKINLTVAMTPVNFTLSRSEQPLVMLDESHNLTATATAAQQEPSAQQGSKETPQVSTSQVSHKKQKKNRG